MFTPEILQPFRKIIMKTTGNTQRRTFLNAWQAKPHGKDTILERIQAITRELGVIQAEMHSQLAAPPGGKISRFFEDGAAFEALNLFKAELDQLRRILWFYIEEAAKNTVADQGEQDRRRERMTGMLRALTPQTNPAEPAVAQAGSFFERLNVVIDTYLEEKKPVESAGKNRGPGSTKAFS